MTILVASVSDESRVLKHLQRVIEDEEWDNVILVGSKDVYKGLFKKKTELILIDMSKTLSELIDCLRDEFKGKITGSEVGVNLICSSGKEHMAILSALLKSGVGIRFVALTREGVKEV